MFLREVPKYKVGRGSAVEKIARKVILGMQNIFQLFIVVKSKITEHLIYKTPCGHIYQALVANLQYCFQPNIS